MLRAKIVLLAAAGRMNKDIVVELKTRPKNVSPWRSRFAAKRLVGIEKDLPRGGRPATLRQGLSRQTIEATTQTKPANATHWSTKTLAKHLGCSTSMVQRVWKANESQHRHQEWTNFLQLIDKQTPQNLDIHMIVDNYATHKHPRVKTWLTRHRRFHMHFTPTSSSWLNFIERWFCEITGKRIRRGTFRSVQQLIDAIMAFIKDHNSNPKSFVWVAQVEDILKKVCRARASLDKTPRG
ncbi:MAG: transposase [Planctomycetota bacterium]